MSARARHPAWRWLPWLVGAVLLAFTLVAGGLWWLGTHERIERKIPLPPQGEAAYNPLYLLREALRADGVDARTRRRLQLDTLPLAADDSVLILGDPRLISAQDAQQLLDWVARGGHLIVSAAFVQADDRRTGGGELLRPLDIRRSSAPSAGCAADAAADDIGQVFCADPRFMLNAEPPAVALGNPSDGYAFARIRHGAGLVDVLASLDFLTNRQLATPPHAALARQVLAPGYGYGTVHLVYAAQMPPLWQWLLEHGPMAWWPWLLALAAWLWLRMPRFGPLRPAPVPARRALMEHVQASGRHLYRYGHTDALVQAMRAAFLARLALRDPLAAALRGKAQYEAIAARTGIAVAAVAAALEKSRENAGGFHVRIACLQQMRHHI